MAMQEPNPCIGLFPALPLAKALDLGDWLIGNPPTDTPWRSPRFRELSESLMGSYAKLGFRNGAMLWHRDHGFDGRRPADVTAHAIATAVSFAVLDANDRLQCDQNKGHFLATAENAALYIQPIDEGDGNVTHVTGGLLKRIFSLGWKIGSEPIPLREATAPIVGTVRPSGKLAKAVYEKMIGEKAGPSRHIQVAIEWHGMAMANSPALTFQQRIIAIKTGFEALLGNSKSWPCAAKLRELFERATASHHDLLPWVGILWSPKERTDLQRTWEDKRHVAHTGTRSELQDWFMALADVRNRIIHEGVVSTDNYPPPPERPLSRYGGSLFWNGERVLREAIKAHLGPEILLAGPLAHRAAMTKLNEALRDESTAENMPPLDDFCTSPPEEESKSDSALPARSLEKLLQELGCDAANHVLLTKAIGMPSASSKVASTSAKNMMDKWIAKVDGRKLLISAAERAALQQVGAEDEIPDEWWDCD